MRGTDNILEEVGGQRDWMGGWVASGDFEEGERGHL